MSPFRIAWMVAGITAALTAGILATLEHGRKKEAARLRRENDRLLAAVLSRQPGPAREAPATAARVEEPKPVQTPDPAGPAKRGAMTGGDYRFAGQETAPAALQSLAWACDAGDAEQVGKLIHFDPRAREKALALFAALPAQDRATWGSFEAWAAGMLTSAMMRSPFPPATILAKASVEPVSEDRVVLRLPDTPKDRTEYQRTAEGWKFVITERMVDGYVASRAP